MNRIFLAAAISLFLACPAFGQAAGSPTPSDEAALKQVEHDWAQAFVKQDSAALGRILAPDWMGQYPWGTEHRPQALAQLAAGTAHVDSMTLNEMHVRVFGDIAFIQGSDDEKSSYAGKDVSGRFSWVDIFTRRNGHWIAIASQLTPVPANK